MERANYNVLFYVKRTKMKKNGCLPIYARITMNGQRAEFVLEKEIEEGNWDSIKGEAKGNSKQARVVNGYLEDVKLKLREAKNEMEKGNEAITANTLKSRYFGVNPNKYTLISLFDEHNSKCEDLINNGYVKKTVDRYKRIKRYLIELINKEYAKNDLMLDEVNNMFVQKFEHYLKTEKKCAHNTTIKYIKHLKKITNIALANGWMKKDPFANIRYKWEPVQVGYLTEDELQKIKNKEFSIKRLEQVRDVYLFCCFTGLAFVDMESLKESDIIVQNGKKWIQKRRQKTNSLSTIPLLPPAEAILEKYKAQRATFDNGKLLPVITNQRMNSYLKEIADLCGIEKNLSTHTARHTFATTVTLSNQVSIEVVSKMLGHSSINMTKRYARVVDTLISKDMEKVYAIY